MKTVTKIWLGLELVSLVLLVRSMSQPGGAEEELSKLPPDVRERVRAAFSGPTRDKLEAAAVELDAYGLHSLSARVRQFALNMQGAA